MNRGAAAGRARYNIMSTVWLQRPLARGNPQKKYDEMFILNIPRGGWGGGAAISRGHRV